jgi:hypothetical protein
MNKKMLWVEDDFYAIKGLIRPLEKAGFDITVTTSATDAYHSLLEGNELDVIFIDLIIPLTNDDQKVMPIIQAWCEEKYVGIGLAKWVSTEMKVNCPIVLLSVIKDPISQFDLGKFNLKYALSKRGLLPSTVKNYTFEMLGMKE